MKKIFFSLALGLIFVTVSGCGVFQKAKKTDDETERLREELARKEEQIENLISKQNSSLEEARLQLEKDLGKELSEYKAKLEMTERGLVITFLAEVFFDSGKADIKEAGFETLDKVAKILNEKVPESNIAIEGHTDADPIKYSGWKSNWELSSGRALSVLHYFIDKDSVAPERLSAVGYGEYKPVASNAAEGKQKNRRVEIVILPNQILKTKSEE